MPQSLVLDVLLRAIYIQAVTALCAVQLVSPVCSTGGLSGLDTSGRTLGLLGGAHIINCSSSETLSPDHGCNKVAASCTLHSASLH